MSINEQAMRVFLEQNGLFNQQALETYNQSVDRSIPMEDWVKYPECVIFNYESHKLYVDVTNNIGLAKDIIDLVLHERNHFCNPWVLCNVFKGIASKSFTVSTAIDIMNMIPELQRLDSLKEYIRIYRQARGYHDLDAIQDAIGAFAGMFQQAIIYIEEGMNNLSGVMNEYYSTLCYAKVNYCDQKMLSLKFTPHGQNYGNNSSFYQPIDLSVIASLACSGSEAAVQNFFLTQSKMNEHNQKVEVINNHINTVASYQNLMSNFVKKPRIFNEHELVKVSQ